MIFIWFKFKPIIAEYRVDDYPRDFLSDFEYLSEAMLRWLCGRDPDLMGKIRENYPDIHFTNLVSTKR